MVDRDYKKYMKTVTWRKITKRVKKRDNYTCQKCGENGRPGNELEVHHKTYGTFKAENMDDLVTLCRGCHIAVHEQIRMSHKSFNRKDIPKPDPKAEENEKIDKVFG